MRDLSNVLGDWHAVAKAHERTGDMRMRDTIQEICRDVASAAEPYLRWLSEAEAVLRSPHAAAWFRARFPAWETQGLARWNPHAKRERQYRQLIVPSRTDIDAVRADAARAAEADSRRSA